jgi:hypothetical protein
MKRDERRLSNYRARSRDCETIERPAREVGARVTSRARTAARSMKLDRGSLHRIAL